MNILGIYMSTNVLAGIGITAVLVLGTILFSLSRRSRNPNI